MPGHQRLRCTSCEDTGTYQGGDDHTDQTERVCYDRGTVVNKLTCTSQLGYALSRSPVVHADTADDGKNSVHQARSARDRSVLRIGDLQFLSEGRLEGRQR